MPSVYSGHSCPIQDSKQSIWWADYLFNRCFYSYWEVSSAFFGITSIVFWLFALLPQLYTNWQRKSTNGVSTYLIWFWIIGDTMSLVGCIVLDQKPFQIILSLYFILTDLLLLAQYYMYKMPEVSEAPVVSCIEETRLLQRSPSGSDMEAISFCPPTTPFEPSRRLQVADDSIKPEPRNANVIAGNSSLFQVPRLGVVLVSVVLFLVWLAVDNYSMLNDSIFRLETFGLLMGWGSSVSYHLSRVPQLWLNHKRKSVEGLSLAMFAIIFAANASYASSLLSMIPVTGLEFFYKSASYVYGPIGSIVIDIFVFIQFFTYRRARALSSDLSLP